MAARHPGFRIFVLGAGFSRAAGLPLASELFNEVRSRIENRHGRNTNFQRNVEHYLQYRHACDGVMLQEAGLDLEDFMSFLDIEHFLQLRGSDTWSDEGNESQLMVRKGIGEVIHNRTPPADRLRPAYYQFADRLSPHDIVITFNYDIVLERALDYVGKPYRLFPDCFKSIGKYSNVVDSEAEEVTVLKLHGSVDWFDDRGFLESKASLTAQGVSDVLLHGVFDDPRRYGAEPIVSGPRSPDDPLLHIFRIRDADAYYRDDRGFNAPFILSPSHVKFVYANTLLSFWRGMGRAGGWNLGMSVIGFSLPLHDEYVRIALYQMITNYQQSWWDERMLDVLKDYVRCVDYRSGDTAVEEYKARYRFIDPDRAAFNFDGFNEQAIAFLFDEQRHT